MSFGEAFVLTGSGLAKSPRTHFECTKSSQKCESVDCFLSVELARCWAFCCRYTRLLISSSSSFDGAGSSGKPFWCTLARVVPSYLWPSSTLELWLCEYWRYERILSDRNVGLIKSINIIRGSFPIRKPTFELCKSQNCRIFWPWEANCFNKCLYNKGLQYLKPFDMEYNKVVCHYHPHFIS